MTDLQTRTEAPDAADAELKARHRAMWASGDYPRLARDLIWALGERVVAAAAIQPDDDVIDIAAGSGNVAIPAALRGANVVATDLAPELFDAGRRQAAAAGAELEWRTADAEALPFPDDAFDVAVSSVGIMFAPHHERAAAELLRVTRPGGRIAILSWTPEGFIGRMFATLKPFAAPLPPGAQPAPLWGDPDHVRHLLGDGVRDLSVTRGSVRVDRFATPEQFRAYFSAHYGPTIAVYARNADDPERVAALDAALDDLAASAMADGGAMEWEYAIATATVV